MPLALRFENGERLTKVLNGEHARIRLIVLHASPIRSAVIDPQYRMFLENRRINNTLRADVGKPEQIRWNLAAVSLLEMLVRGLAW